MRFKFKYLVTYIYIYVAKPTKYKNIIGTHRRTQGWGEKRLKVQGEKGKGEYTQIFLPLLKTNPLHAPDNILYFLHCFVLIY